MVFTYVMTYFIVGFVCFCIATTYLAQLSMDMGSTSEVNAFRLFDISYLVFVVTNMIWVWSNNGYISLPGTINSMLNLISICTAAYFWFRFIEIKLNPDVVNRKGFVIVSMLPLIAALLLIISSPVTKLVFYYENNEYVHGPLYSVMFILAVLYLIYASVHILIRVGSVQTISRKTEYRSLSMFMVFPVLGGLIDLVIPNLPIMELALLFSICMAYSALQRSQINIDSLTSMSNRRRADDFLDEGIRRASVKRPLFLFIGEIDNFKAINDKYGHVEGDKALRVVAEGFESYAMANDLFTARWSGIQFVIISSGASGLEPEGVIAGLKRSIKDANRDVDLPFDINITVGYSSCIDSGTKASTMIKIADRMIYENKGSDVANMKRS